MRAAGAHISCPLPRRFVSRFPGFLGNAAHVLCRTADYYMQMTSRAKLRQRLDLLLDEHRHLLEVAFERTPLWRGIVHESRRRCGKPTCCCARGELHTSTVFSDRSGERQRNLALKGKILERFRGMTEAYRHLRRNRARAVAVQREVLEIFDALEVARRQGALERYARDLPPQP